MIVAAFGSLPVQATRPFRFVREHQFFMSESQDSDLDKRGEELNAQRFQMLADIAKELAGEVVFPTYFDAAFRLRRELQNPELPLSRMATIVSLEPLVASRLMNLAGSVMYSPDGSAPRDLKTAIKRLGIEVVRTTALAIAMNQLMRSKETAVFSDLARLLWDHSMKSAAATRLLARKFTRINPDEAMLAGLVHDLGAFYMLYRAAQYSELRVRPDSVRFLILQWHESIGVTLFGSLDMPDEVVIAATDHDQVQPLPETPRSLADLVYLGNLLAGGHTAWSGVAEEDYADLLSAAAEQYADLLPVIENDAKAMLSVFV